MRTRKILPYNPALKRLARDLRNNSTFAEVVLWRYLKGKQMLGFDFHRQKPIDNYIADFFCCELMLAIEIDGHTHDLEEVKLKDAQKEKRLASFGVTILRFSDDDVFVRTEETLEKIRQWIITHPLPPL